MKMSRPPIKILTFKRLTEVGSIQQSALGDRVKKRVLSIRNDIRNRKLPPFARAYVYVALATCLESDLKYKCRMIMELAGNDIDVFRKLYGEGKFDLDLLFHVVDESITLSDLVAEATTVSDLPSLVNRCEVILNTLSGGKFNLQHHFDTVAKEDEKKELLRELLPRLPSIKKEIDKIFQIRHAVVHDVYIGQVSIQRALRPKKMLSVIHDCIAFLLLIDRAYEYWFTNGVLRPELHHEKSKLRHEKQSSDAFDELRRLKKSFPNSRSEISKLETWFEELAEILFDILNKVESGSKEESLMSPYLADTYFSTLLKVARAITLECSAKRP